MIHSESAWTIILNNKYLFVPEAKHQNINICCLMINVKQIGSSINIPGPKGTGLSLDRIVQDNSIL